MHAWLAFLFQTKVELIISRSLHPRKLALSLKLSTNNGERTNNNQLQCQRENHCFMQIVQCSSMMIMMNARKLLERERKFLTCGWQGQGEGFPGRVGRRTCRDIQRKGKTRRSSRQGNHFHTWYRWSRQCWPRKSVAPTMRTTDEAVECRNLAVEVGDIAPPLCRTGAAAASPCGCDCRLQHRHQNKQWNICCCLSMQLQCNNQSTLLLPSS